MLDDTSAKYCYLNPNGPLLLTVRYSLRPLLRDFTILAKERKFT